MSRIGIFYYTLILWQKSMYQFSILFTSLIWFSHLLLLSIINLLFLDKSENLSYLLNIIWIMNLLVMTLFIMDESWI